MSEGRTKYTLEQLAVVANELNGVLGLNPPINLHFKKDDMEDHVLEACKMVNLRLDKFTPETHEIVLHLRRNFNKYVRFQQAKTIRVAEYIRGLLKQGRFTRNQIRNMAVRHFNGTVSNNLIESVLSFARKKHIGHKKHRFGNYYMEMEPVTKIEKLVKLGD